MLETLITSRIVDTNDEGLRRYTFDRLKVIAKFTVDNCPICKLLEPVFIGFAEEEEYQGILFVRLNSNESPVARQLMNERAAPFFVSYHQGRMLECDTRETEAAVLAQLARLRAAVPFSG